jgi:hypothetical protein
MQAAELIKAQQFFHGQPYKGDRWCANCAKYDDSKLDPFLCGPKEFYLCEILDSHPYWEPRK